MALTRRTPPKANGNKKSWWKVHVRGGAERVGLMPVEKKFTKKTAVKIGGTSVVRTRRFSSFKGNQTVWVVTRNGKKVAVFRSYQNAAKYKAQHSRFKRYRNAAVGIYKIYKFTKEFS